MQIDSTYIVAAQYALEALMAIILFDYIFGWMERKIIARVQSRHGPTKVGKFGLLQNMADVIKLLSKEKIVPDKANKILFVLIPPFALWLSMLMVFMLPLYAGAVASSLSLGLIGVFVILSFTPLLIFLGGFATGNKYGAISAERSVFMMLAYEIPMLIAVANIGIAAGTFNIAQIVSAQQSTWFAFSLPIAFIVFFITTLAEMERVPFDIREADSELIAGWLVDIPAPYYAIALFIDYTRMLLGSLLIALLFLGGWAGPMILPPLAWLFIKVFAVAIAVTFIRATMVRMRLDRLMRLGWFILLPLALLGILLTFIIV